VPVEPSVPQRDVPGRAAASGARPPVSGGETLARVLAAGDSNRLIRFTYTRHWNPGVRVYTVRVRRVVAGPGGWEVQGQVAERDWALRRFGLSRISDLDPDVGPVPAGQPSTPPSWQPAQHDVDLPKSLHWLTDRWAQKVEPVKGSPTALRLTLDQPADDRLALLLLLAGPTATTSRLKPRATAVEWARDLERAYETGLPRHVNAG
jgi:predicted DNA-binding transcriptional regulator YafY